MSLMSTQPRCTTRPNSPARRTTSAASAPGCMKTCLIPSFFMESSTPKPILGEIMRFTASTFSERSSMLLKQAPVESYGLTLNTVRPASSNRFTTWKAGLASFRQSPTTAHVRKLVCPNTTPYWEHEASDAFNCCNNSQSNVVDNPKTQSMPPSMCRMCGATLACSIIKPPAHANMDSSTSTFAIAGSKCTCAVCTPTTRRPVPGSCKHSAPTRSQGAEA
mmetsp:Transcript_105590/g.305501  ORF Transcript_105590/g.305501 Transcript_105590/m.305501 type:complete len:220 (-) Transcript_105590:453-1112(-)